MWIDLQHGGLAIETSNCKIDFATRNRAHSTQVLAQDEVGIATGEGFVVK
jgi:hypothetical protein